MQFLRSFHEEIVKEFDSFLDEQRRRFPADEVLTIDLHCHDYNSDIPDELLGRMLGVPETWLSSDDLLRVLQEHGCDTFTVTNHNNARSCYELQERGIDVLPAAEFSCHVPDFNTGIHVLAYGITPKQVETLNKLRGDLYRFKDFTAEHDIPTIWDHPLYHHVHGSELPLEFFDKLSLLFECFEVINGQRDTWQNMLVKLWIETLTEERIDELAKSTGIPAHRYCRNPYRKVMAGGSDSHMGIFTGLTGSRLHVPELSQKLKFMSRSMLALEVLKKGTPAPFGATNDSEKMTVSFLDYFCQIAINLKDPGLLRILLHKGTTRDRILGLLIANGFAEVKRHKVTMEFLELFHQCFGGTVPGFMKRLVVPKVYKPIFDKASVMAEIRRDEPHKAVVTFREKIEEIYAELNRIFFSRVNDKLAKFAGNEKFKSMNLLQVVESLDLPSEFRRLIEQSNGKNGTTPHSFTELLDGLSFPFLASAVIASASFASAKVMYNSRELLTSFSERLGRLQHPKRLLWLTDTFEDNNGVAMVLHSIHEEIKRRNLPIDLLVCSAKVQPDDHLIVLPPSFEYEPPFYAQQALRIPNLMDIHRIFKVGEYDRIICSTEGPMGFISLFLKHAYSVPAYFYVHTDWIMFARQVLDFDEEGMDRLRRILRVFYHGFDGLFVLNSDQQKWLAGKDMGFDPAQIFLTAHWADEGFEPKKVNRAEQLGVKEQDPVLLFAGRISEEKGVLELPAVYRKVKEVFPKCKIVFAGTGPMEQELKNQIPDAVYLGWVNHDQLPEVYSAADLLLLPSRFDTFGCVVLEALSCGLPVAAYKTKGPKDIIEHGKNGYLVKTRSELTNAILQYLGDRNRQKSFRKAALKRAEDYEAGAILDAFLRQVGLGEDE